MLEHQLGVKFVHLVIIADNAQTVGSCDKGNLGYSAVEKRLSLSEMEEIVTSEREGAYLGSVFERFEIDIVHRLVSRVNDFCFHLSDLLVFAVLGFPHFTAEMLNGKSCNRLEVTFLAVPMTSVRRKPF